MASTVEGASQSRFVDVDGPVHLVDTGPAPGGPLIVCIHGLGGSHLNWMAVAPMLARGARVVTLDLVGHGLTPMGDRTADIGGHRRLVSGVLRSLGGHPAILVGNSMGGLIAALQAAEEPDSVAGLVLIDPALPAFRGGVVHPRVLANFVLCMVPGLGERYLAERRRRTTDEESVRRVLRICCADPSRVAPHVVAAHVELTERLGRSASDAAYLSSARSLSSTVMRARQTVGSLRRITQPVLLVHGDRDVLVPLAAARQLSAAHPAWRFEVARGVGHLPMMEAPEWTVQAIMDWLAREGSGAAQRSRSPAGGVRPAG